jgi:hypothetical protein
MPIHRCLLHDHSTRDPLVQNGYDGQTSGGMMIMPYFVLLFLENQETYDHGQEVCHSLESGDILMPIH